MKELMSQDKLITQINEKEMLLISDEIVEKLPALKMYTHKYNEKSYINKNFIKGMYPSIDIEAAKDFTNIEVFKKYLCK